MPREYKPKSADEIRRNMSAIRSKDNKTETALRKALFKLGLRYRKYSPRVLGRPDIVFPTERVVVFVDGDYWHGRMLREAGPDALNAYYAEHQRGYWVTKLQRTVIRDDSVRAMLEADGWEVIRLWESDVKKELALHARLIAECVRRRRQGINPRR